MIACDFQNAFRKCEHKHFILQMSALGVIEMIFQFYLHLDCSINVPQVPL